MTTIIKLLEQSKNEIAKEYGYESFEQLNNKSTFGYDHRTPEMIDKIAERYHELMSEHNLKEFEEMPLYDLSNVPENNKSEFIESWTKTVSEQAIKIYMMFGLKSGIESMVINDATGQEFIFSFKSLPQPPKQ
jgi:hypothetical protein